MTVCQRLAIPLSENVHREDQVAIHALIRNVDVMFGSGMIQ